MNKPSQLSSDARQRFSGLMRLARGRYGWTYEAAAEQMSGFADEEVPWSWVQWLESEPAQPLANTCRLQAAMLAYGLHWFDVLSALRLWSWRIPEEGVWFDHDAEKRLASGRPGIARGAMAKAIKSGFLVRGECSIGKGCEGRIEGHHWSYLPGLELDVEWMCRRHHRAMHFGRLPGRRPDQRATDLGPILYVPALDTSIRDARFILQVKGFAPATAAAGQ